MSEWAGWFELVIVLAFAAGYGAIELQCRRLDRQRAREQARQALQESDPEPDAERP